MALPADPPVLAVMTTSSDSAPGGMTRGGDPIPSAPPAEPILALTFAWDGLGHLAIVRLARPKAGDIPGSVGPVDSLEQPAAITTPRIVLRKGGGRRISPLRSGWGAPTATGLPTSQ